MNVVTKMKIMRPVNELFEAFVDPAKISNFWFSSSSDRWEQGKTITLRYDEYDAQGEIKITEIETNKKIVFCSGANGEGNKVTISLKQLGDSESIIEINEEGFDEKDDNIIDQLLDNKEGWVYMLTCLKGYLEYGVNLRASLVKE
ncbi:MAG: hypothetical protein GX750_07610 [Clostridia bacterium]|nr:hypothetical protein [Clostridia bacterium]